MDTRSRILKEDGDYDAAVDGHHAGTPKTVSQFQTAIERYESALDDAMSWLGPIKEYLAQQAGERTPRVDEWVSFFEDTDDYSFSEVSINSDRCPDYERLLEELGVLK
jgi:hypothetical protein